MPGFIAKRSRFILRLLAVFLLTGWVQPVWAAGPPEPSPFSNPLAVTLIVLMLLLLIIIAILGNILLGSADIRLKKNRTPGNAPGAVMLILFMLTSGGSLLAQGTTAAGDASAPASTIGGMSATTFYIMAGVIFLELLVIVVLLLNIRSLIRTEQEKAAVVKPLTETEKVKLAEEKKSRLSWWDRFNKLRPVTQESELDLGHDYDGIRELNNRLPPWWLYGFYVSIIFAVIYLWRFHVSHTGPSSREEYETAVAEANLKVEQYLKAKGENVDENTVTLLTAQEDLEAGKNLFTNGPCGTCHGKDGSGYVNGAPGAGPNLTDDYWIHGGSVKDVFSTIKYGVLDKGMPTWESQFKPKEIAQMASYIKSLRGSNPPVHKGPDGPLYVDPAAPAQPVSDSTHHPSDSMKTKDNKVALR